MSFYARRVLPHIIDLAMKNKDATRLREAWIPLARGEVLEIGIGSGLNLPFYSTQVERVYGVEPCLCTPRDDTEEGDGRTDQCGIPVTIGRGSAAASRSKHRHNRDDLDAVLHPGRAESPCADEACPQGT